MARPTKYNKELQAKADEITKEMILFFEWHDNWMHKAITADTPKKHIGFTRRYK